MTQDTAVRSVGTAGSGHATPALAPGSVIEVRDEEWLVTAVSTVREWDPNDPDATEPTKPVQRIEAQGLSELVRDTNAVFLDSIDRVRVLDPKQATLVNDTSAQYRDSRLWLEATLRKTPLPAEDTRITLAGGMLIDPKDYQLTPVRKILDPVNLRPRILLADAVGLGKTIEIGLILAELIKRGRGDRILIVTPKHVLEQMQHEMWTKFALPFVRLDSDGIAAIRRSLPATRNPFTYYKRAIISIDTLKSDRYLAHLRKHRWDAVVIDESHNVTNTASLNNRLATVLAQNTDALVLASATPHNGKKESFAELIRLLEPTAISPSGDVDPADIDRLVVRRHRYSPDVAAEVGTQWAERKDPVAITVTPSPQENAIATELDTVWIHPRTAPSPSAPAGVPTSSPYSGDTKALFPWTLAKAFLSSPEALKETVDNRLRTLGLPVSRSTTAPEAPTPAADNLSSAAGQASSPAEVEAAALHRLRTLAQDAIDAAQANRDAKAPQTGKYGALLSHLREIGVAKKSPTRAVVFAERVVTLNAISAALPGDLGLKPDQVAILHGGMSDVDQLAVVDEFKRASSPLRVLVTGDVASEGVNLHAQCHQLIHYDIPWSLIRIEQRNGRIDRYGQTNPPQITTLVLDPDTGAHDQSFSGDIRVLQRLIEKEHEAHRALGDAAALMGKYSADAEEQSIREALAQGRDVDEIIEDVTDAGADVLSWLTGLMDTSPTPVSPAPGTPPAAPSTTPPTTARSTDDATGLVLYREPIAYVRDALASAYQDPTLPVARGGVDWDERPDLDHAQLVPPRGMVPRLEALPQSYLKERRVRESLQLATSKRAGLRSLDLARQDSDSLWPQAHFLGPLHPVLAWADDRALANLGQHERNAVYAVRADVAVPTVVLHSQLTNLRGQSVTSMYSTVVFQDGFGFVQPASDITQIAQELELDRPRSNHGDIDLSEFQDLIRQAVEKVEVYVGQQVAPAARQGARQRVEAWKRTNTGWVQEALTLAQTKSRRSTRVRLDDEAHLIKQMEPGRMITRPLLLAVPLDSPAAATATSRSAGGR